MDLRPDLRLPSRTGTLPAEVAFLREKHPPSGWRAARNFGELAAFWLSVHDSLRDHGSQLREAAHAFREGQVDAAAFSRFFGPRLSHFVQHLDRHHRIEDAAYFPRFRSLDPRMQVGFELLENDHGFIHDSLLTTAASGRRLMLALGTRGEDPRTAAGDYADASDGLLALLLQHLSDEEDLVIPALLEHTERAILS